MILSEPATITSAPLLARQADESSSFIGYTDFDGTWIAENCEDGSAIIESSVFAACAPTQATSFGIATTCLDGSILAVPPAVTYSCSPNVCYTILLFTDTSDQSPHSLFGCDSVSRKASLYRTTPVSTGAQSSSPGAGAFTRLANLTETSSSPTTGSLSATSLLLISSLPSGSTPPTSAISSSETGASGGSGSGSGGGGGGQSKAWIAGAVVGPVAAIVIAGLAFWIWKLRRHQRQDQSQAAISMGQDPSMKPPMSQSAVPGQPQELASALPPQELASTERQRAELEGTKLPLQH